MAFCFLDMTDLILYFTIVETKKKNPVFKQTNKKKTLAKLEIPGELLTSMFFNFL